MLKNYLKTAFRNLLREKGITLINLSGLTLGITCSLTLFLMVRYMSSYDTFHSKGDRIYRIVDQSQGNNGQEYQAGVPTVLPDAFRTDFPEAEEVVFFSDGSDALIAIPQRTGEDKRFFVEDGIAFTEPSYFKIFDRSVTIGNAQTGLDEPNEAIISRSMALKYFGTENPTGEVFRYGSDKEFKITAVMEDAPHNTDLPFDLLLSYSTIKKQRDESGWNSIWSGEQCYFLLKEGEDIQKLQSRMEAFSAKYIGKDDPDKTQFTLQPLREIHMDDRYDVYGHDTVSKSMLISFAVIGAIILLTACINFINLSTAEAIKRSKEVGVRKSLGSTRGQLIFQFLGETTLVTLFAVVLSLGLTQVGLVFLNPFTELNLVLDLSHDVQLWIFLAATTAVVSLFSGLYPAFVVSRFKPALAMKNAASNKNSSGYILRRSLVVMQFFISQILIIGTLVIINQMNFYNKQDLGFNKDAILIVPIPDGGGAGVAAKQNQGQTVMSRMRTLREEIATIPGVEQASLCSNPPSSGNVQGTNFKMSGSADDHATQVKQIDGNYLGIYGIQLVAGKNVADLDTANGYLVNEKFAHVAGFTPDEIVGKNVRVWGKDLPVVGVVKDFHTVSLREPIEATILFNRSRGYENLSIKVNMKNATQVIEHVKAKWLATYPEHLFDYSFLDENIRNFYDGFQRTSIMLTVFTGLAIFIGCLGLFGLASFMANQKTKEVGIRKVMGASVESILLIFTKEFITLIAIGFLIAAPVGWYAMTMFLNEFAYRIELGPGIFLATLGLTLLIAGVTVGFKSFRAATTNPVQALRSE